jgi:hypothetical protein
LEVDVELVMEGVGNIVPNVIGLVMVTILVNVVNVKGGVTGTDE